MNSSRIRTDIACLGVALLLTSLIPNTQSLWIDEGFTIPYAAEQSMSGFLARLAHDEGSEALMPLGMLCTWVGGKVLGRSEFALRLVSSFWAVVAVVLMWRIGVVVGMPWLAVILASHPFLWYYGSEIRPYAMVIAMATGALLGMAECLCSSGRCERGILLVAIFGPLLFATHLLGILPFASASAVVVATLISKRARLSRPRWAIISIAALMTVGVGLLLLLGISRGAETAWHESPWQFSFASLLFAGYELGGFSGFGPGRLELRELMLAGGPQAVLAGMVRPALLGAIGLLFLYASFTLSLFKKRRWQPTSRRRLFLATAGVVAITSIITVAVFAAGGNNVWGRHLAGLLPFFVLGVGLALELATQARGPLGQRKICVGALIALLLLSSLIVRFHPEHRRDDYRTAAGRAVAAARDGRVVWWAADGKVAEYYGIRFCDGNQVQDGCVVYTANESLADLMTAIPPEMIVFSKPELHDRQSGIRHYLESAGFARDSNVLAFSIYSVSRDVGNDTSEHNRASGGLLESVDRARVTPADSSQR